MTAIDWFILFIYASSTIGLGWYVGRKQETSNEYFVGSGKMSPILVGVSLFATLLSTISYLALPGEVAGKGPVFLTNYLVYPFIYMFIAWVLLPIYMRHRVTSAYELLENQLGLSIRLLGATLFVLLRLVWMAVLVYLTAKAIATMIGADDAMVPWIVVATGGFAIAYTSMGGLRAVVITDLMQSILLYGGALLVLGTITWNMGGLGWFPTHWQPDVWDSQQIFSFDPATRVTVVGSMLSVFLWTIATAAGDQVAVQRYMATEDVKAARRAIAIQLACAVLVGITLGMVGIALLGYYQAHPELLPRGTSLRLQADELFPHFIANRLPPIVTGLVVSGLFAAAMSSIDSGVNSIAAVVMTDFLDRFGLKPQTEAKHLLVARLLAVAIGAIIVTTGSLIEYIPGNFMAITNKTVNLLSVPIALLFFFALYVPFSNAIGVWIATIAGVGVAVLIAFSGVFFGMNPETGSDPISFQWIQPAALLTGGSVGVVACKLFSRKGTPIQA